MSRCSDPPVEKLSSGRESRIVTRDKLKVRT